MLISPSQSHRRMQTALIAVVTAMLQLKNAQLYIVSDPDQLTDVSATFWSTKTQFLIVYDDEPLPLEMCSRPPRKVFREGGSEIYLKKL